ncbi:CRISPR-associated protein Cas3 [Lampropedia cohaerens]|uniref:CRISPR-associated protein Cas3 n=2 Tax=Lampropedia cohaerens TaxID=1610491 RepID=A0A0U1PY62_9BURK|nr:CRISPR-associated protein Cas3 [Lampropedia cohaerens]
MRYSSLPPQTRVLWAKSGEAGGRHGLLSHLLDVAAVAECILELESSAGMRWAASQMGLPADLVPRWVATIVGLHDFGKAIPGFQAKWEAGKLADIAQGLAFPPSACTVDNHACATAAILGPLLRKASGAERDWCTKVVQAISAHHGYHFLSSEVDGGRPFNEPKPWAQARQALFDAYWRTLSPQGVPHSETLNLTTVNWLAGLTSAADWIASNPEWFPLGERGHDALSDYFLHARQLARAALAHIGWRAMQVLLRQDAPTSDLLARVAGQESLSARPLQSVGDALLKAAQGPALLLVEAPMGEGKTELAFLAHLRLQAINAHRGLYVALPTQATGNAMFRRVQRFLQRFVEKPTDIQLVHGGAAMNEDVVRLRGIDHSCEAALSASAWFAQRRRPLLSPYGVGTVDQALLCTLNVKHHFVRLWGLSNRVVVLDEVHAYDTYTSGLIVVLLQWLKAAGSSVVLMSATLPRARRDELLAAWNVAANDVPELPYPRVLLADDVGVRGDTFSARTLPPIHLHGLGTQLEDMADTAVEQLAGGGCGALIVNTVDRAQALYRMLRERLQGTATELLLFHARFPADDRRRLEQRVLEKFGATETRPQRALLVATQVAEQSLDIDFDFMLSDLAPVDLLLQRAGRLHRHADRVRPPSHARAQLWVAGLMPEFPDLEETAWGFVYDPYILGRTWAKLQHETLLQLPEDIDRLVQWVYGSDPLPEGLAQSVQDSIELAAYGEHLANEKRQRQQALNATLDSSVDLGEAYNGKPRGNEEGDDIRNKTRLGRDSVTLIPVEKTAEGWKVGDCIFQPDQMLDNATARQLYNRQVSVSKPAIVRHFQTGGCGALPASFAENGLLRYFYPLVLNDGCYTLDKLCIKLDKELGLVLEPVSLTDGGKQ